MEVQGVIMKMGMYAWGTNHLNLLQFIAMKIKLLLLMRFDEKLSNIENYFDSRVFYCNFSMSGVRLRATKNWKVLQSSVILHLIVIIYQPTRQKFFSHPMPHFM